MNRLKNFPLFLQISIIIGIITIFISGVMIIALPHTLRSFFTREMYNTIEAAQSSFIKPEDFNKIPSINSKDVRTVKHIILKNNGEISSQVDLPLNYIREIRANAFSQNNNVEKYSYSDENLKLFYIIRKVKIEHSFFNLVESQDAYLVSFLNDSYREDLVSTLFKKLVSLSILILLISFIPALILSKYLSKPLVNLSKRVERLSLRQWKEEINLDRKDEIGQLGDSVEKLRQELLKQDSLQQNFLQNISHELKTPIMVIKSYTEAIRDGIYPGGDLVSSLDVINMETTRLEKKVKSLLYITKLDYLSGFKLDRETFSLSDLISQIVDKYKLVTDSLRFETNLEPVLINGDKEQITVVIENILDNMLRYAKTNIQISLDENQLQIYNDGEHIEEENLINIFNKFHKGQYGEVGLGLSIVKKILDLHGFSIRAQNESIGLSFYINFKEE